MGGDEVADNLAPHLEHFGFVKALLHPKPLHQLGQHVDRRVPTIRPRKSFRQSAPLSNRAGAERRIQGHESILRSRIENPKPKIENTNTAGACCSAEYL